MNLKKSGHHPPGTMVFSQLRPGINETTILVRVTRAWKSVSTYDSTEMMANFILLDEEDNQLHAIAHAKEMDRIWSKLCEDLLYYVTNFKYIVSPVKWRPVSSNKFLLFCQQTKIDDCCDGIGISDMKFDLQMLSTLKPHQSQSPNFKTLTDVCGVLLKVTDMGSPFNDVDQLHVTLMDSSCVSVTVILWGRQATLFGVQFNLHRKLNTILIVPGLRIKQIKGHTYLFSTPATQILYNPVYEPLQNVQELVKVSYGCVICRKPQPPSHDNRNTPAQSNNFTSIHQLHFARNMLREKNWSKDSCVCCSSDVTLQYNTYYCKKCERLFSPYINRSMLAILADSAGNTGEFIIQPREIAQLIGMSPMQLVCTTVDQHPQIVKGTPNTQVIDNIKGSKCSVEAHYYPDSAWKKNGIYVIKMIIESSKLAKKRKAGKEQRADYKASIGEKDVFLGLHNMQGKKRN